MEVESKKIKKMKSDYQERGIMAAGKRLPKAVWLLRGLLIRGERNLMFLGLEEDKYQTSKRLRFVWVDEVEWSEEDRERCWYVLAGGESIQIDINEELVDKFEEMLSEVPGDFSEVVRFEVDGEKFH